MTVLGVEHHAEQWLPNSCVAACVGMVLRARGLPFGSSEEAAMMLCASAGGLQPAAAAAPTQGRVEYLGPEEFLDRAPLWLSGGCSILVAISGPRYVARCGHTPGGSPSRHGDLAQAGEFAMPLHSVVLTGRAGDGFEYLDPYYPARGQPLSMPDDLFVYLFAGTCVIVP